MNLLLWVWEQTKSDSQRLSRTHLMWLRGRLGKNAKNPRHIFAEPEVGCWEENQDRNDNAGRRRRTRKSNR